MAEIMGTGILSLPSTMAGLGYILGSVAIVVMAVAVYFQGFLLAKVKNRYYSQALSYGTLPTSSTAGPSRSSPGGSSMQIGLHCFATTSWP